MVTADAADWYVRLRAGNFSALETARFKAALASNSHLRRELEELDLLWNELAAIEHAPEILRERESIRAQRRGIAEIQGVRGTGPGADTPERQRVRTKALSWAAAASVVIAVGVFAWVQIQPTNDYTTAVGEQRVIPLEDGSVVTMNTASELRLHYSATQRTVELLTGQANFEVAKDAQRPFVVQVGGGEVRAVGTVFDVYKAGERVTVTLLEGKVAVLAESEGAAPAHEESPQRQRPAPQMRRGARDEIVLTAGEQVSYGTGAPIAKRVSADIHRISAWRVRKLDFDDTLLVDAIAEANRYSNVKIDLQTPGLETAKISGVFEAGKNELFVEGLQTYFGLHAERTADDRIVLTARQGSGSPATVP